MKRTILAFALLAFVPGAQAKDLVYTPIDPSFGGNPLNSSHLLAVAGAQREATATDANDALSSPGGGSSGGSSGLSDAQLFVQQLQGRLLSALASQVTDAIFGTNPQESGTVQFGDTTVTFARTLGSIELDIYNALDGTTTHIVVPQLVTSTAPIQ